MTQHGHALDLPEIASLIESKLTRSQLCKCIQVSRCWHDAFVPFLWDLTLLKNVYFSRYPSPEGLQRYSRLIRQLSYSDLPVTDLTPRYFQVQFPYLVSFQGHYLPRSQWTEDERKYWGKRDPLLGFLELLDPKPFSLTLDSHFDELKDETDDDLEHSIWKVIMAGCKTLEADGNKSLEYGTHTGPVQSLRSLTLNRVTFHWREMYACEGIWDVLKNLDSLTIQIWSHSRIKWPIPTGHTPMALTAGETAIATTTGQNLSHPFEKMAGAKIQHLKIVFCEHGDPTLRSEFELVRQCRNLRSLVWINTNCKYPNVSHIPAFILEVQLGRWPFLESLDLSIPHLQDSQLEIIIRSMATPLREISVQGDSFGMLAGEALLNSGGGRHVKRLEVLKIPQARHARGEFLQKVLCSSPNLVTLHGCMIRDLDIWRFPEPWVCHKLKDFQVSLCFELGDPVPMGSLFSKAKDNRQTLVPGPSTPPRPLEMATDEDTVAVFLGRLAKCTDLETLLMGQREHLATTTLGGRMISTYLTYQTLELDYGLDQLKTLKQLRHLDMRFTHMDMTMLEAEWMMKHWPNLGKFYATQVSRDHDLTRDMWLRFKAQDIQRTWCFD